MPRRTDSRPSIRPATLAQRAWGPLRRLLAGSAFVPVSIVLVCVLVALTGAQVARLYRETSAAGWWTPRDPVTFTGPGLDGAPTTFQAFILGAVALPGAYQLPSDARVADLVTAAGGLLPTADASALDETASLADGQQVYVPYKGQSPVNASASLVNINTASADELHASLGLTSLTAGRIIGYRDRHGPFTALSQLLLVPVSRTIFDRIKYLVTL
jgi:competence protein ComEA